MAFASVFYYLQGQPGEDASHPNYFRVERHASPTLAQLRDAFPLRGTGRFHFRFKTAVAGAAKSEFVWQDVTDPSSLVPKFGSKFSPRSASALSPVV